MTRPCRLALSGWLAAASLIGGLASCSSEAGPCEAYNDYYDEYIQNLKGSLAENPVEWRESQRLLEKCYDSGGDPTSGDV